MIEKLFPNSTLHQVKLKFKNEECKNPFPVHDVFNNYYKDHSLFHLVIEQMQIMKEPNSHQDLQDNPAGTSQDASHEDEEEQAELHEDEGEDYVQYLPEAVNVSKDELDESTTPNGNENENENENVFVWDDDDGCGEKGFLGVLGLSY